MTASTSSVVHWHDTPLFEQVRDARVARLKATDDEDVEAEFICRHINEHTPLDSFYFMRSPLSGKGHFMCRACCASNVELELLTMHEPPTLRG